MVNIEKIKITDIVPAEYNPRKISDEELLKLKNSIGEFGLVDPIIINLKNNKIIGGHQRFDVLINEYMLNNDFYAELNILKFGDVGWVFTDTDLRIESEEHEKALNLALNKISGEWDFEKLAIVLDELELKEFDIELTGFDGLDELDFDLGEDYDPDEGEFEIDEDEYIPSDDIEVTVKLGDIYKLGSHRLMCGDCTKEEDVSKLMDGNLADMVFTDPPYNVNYKARGVVNKLGSIENDNMSDDEFNNFCHDFFKMYNDFLVDMGAIYVCHPDPRSAPKIAFEVNFAEYFHKASTIIWAKQNASMGWQDYRNKHEPILYGWKKGGGKHNFFGDRTNNTLWEFSGDNRMDYSHPTQKPVGLPAKAIQNSSKENNIVLDLFGGSGSTLIASEQTDRICYMLEIDPYYCQIIINRWEELTGEKAEKIEG